MAFQPMNLSVLAYANNFTLWHYITSDKEIQSPGYFNKAADMLRKNDLIIANIDAQGSPATRFYLVAQSDRDHVDLSAYG